MRFAQPTDINKLASRRELVNLGELKDRIGKGEGPFYCLSTIKATPQAKAAIITGLRTPITAAHIARLLDEGRWAKDPSLTIAVTTNPDLFEDRHPLERTLRDYADLFHHFLKRYLNPSSRTSSEAKNLFSLTSQLFATHLWHGKIKEFILREEDLRPLETYEDHMANSALLFLSVFALMNKRRQEWRQTGPLSAKKPRTYELGNLVRDIPARDVPQVAVPDLVLSGFLGALFHDASLAGLTPMDLAPGCFSDEPPEGLAEHPEESWVLVRAKFGERFTTKALVKNHHEREEDKKKRAAKEPSPFELILPVVDYYDELSSSEPVLFRLAELMRHGEKFSNEACVALLELIEPFKKGEKVTVYAEHRGKTVSIASAAVTDAADKLMPLVEIGAVFYEEFEGLMPTGKTVQVNPFAKVPMYI